MTWQQASGLAAVAAGAMHRGARARKANSASAAATRDRAPESSTGRRAESGRLVSVLERCPLLTGLERCEVEEIAALCRFQPFPAQTDIFIEGQACDGLWVLASGRVRLYHSAADGRQHVVSFRGESSPLELGSALDGRAYTATATALEDCVLVYVPKAVLSHLARNYPVTVRNTIEQLCLELRQRDIATAVATLKDARGRIGCTLLQLARQYGQRLPDGVRIGFRLTRQDIADRSGVTIETAIRVLSDLQRQGVLRTQAQVIDILDADRLQHPTNCGVCQFDCSVFGPAVFRGAANLL